MTRRTAHPNRRGTERAAFLRVLPTPCTLEANRRALASSLQVAAAGQPFVGSLVSTVPVKLYFTVIVALAWVGGSGAAPQVPPDGIWIARAALQQLPTSGAAWTRLAIAAQKRCGAPQLDDQDDDTNTCILAKALVAARTDDAVLRRAVVDALQQVADGRPFSGRALALGRELIAYVIAADLITLQAHAPEIDARFRARITSLLTAPAHDGPATLIECHEERANNWGTHCGASRVAVAAYLGDVEHLARAAAVFKGFLGDRSAYAGFRFGDLSWQCDPERPVPINPARCSKGPRSIDGVLPDDQRRAGAFRWPAPRENYVYEALQGALAQAIILQRAGYDSFGWEDQALRRAFEWLYVEAGYPASGDDAWQVSVINHFYGTRFTASGTPKPGKNVGWTDWTHGR
jgi:hypothetical protein